MRDLLLAVGVLAAVTAGPAAVSAAPVTVSGESPFAGCTADDVAGQPGTNVPDSEVEPWIDVDPRNPMHLVGGWQQDRWSNGGARGNVAAVSFDGGATWTSVIVPGITLCSGGEFERASDPWVSFAPNGDVYFFSLVTDAAPPEGREGGFGKNAMIVNRSTNGGLGWGDPVVLARDDNPRFLNDKNTLTADPTDPDFAYAVWDRLQSPNGVVINPENVFGLGFKGPAVLSRTTDGGRTWSAPTVIYEPGGNNQTIGNQIVVAPDGTLYDFFNEILNFKNNDGDAQFDFTLSVITSRDKGATWSKGKPTRIANMLSRALFDQFGVRDPDTNAPIRTGDIIPEVTVDPSDGTLYAVWQDARFSGFAHDSIALSLSTDGGRTWTAPVQVNQTPERPGQLAAAFTPAVKVSADGTIGVTYYDFRNHAPGASTLATDAFLVRLRRSGTAVSAIDETRLTPASFDMRRAPVARGFFLGDYMGLGVAGNTFLPFFSVTTGTDPANVVLTTVGP